MATAPRVHDALVQGGYRYRFDWGPMGLRRLGPSAEVVVAIVEVLSFATAVDMALGAGATVLPDAGTTATPPTTLGRSALCRPSPGAVLAAAAGTEAWPVLADCGSGRQLLADGWAEDVRLAAQVNVSDTVPELVDGAFVPA